MKILIRITFLLFFAVCTGTFWGVQAQSYNRPVPGDFPPYEFRQNGPAPAGSFLVAPFRNFSPVPRPPYVSILDSAGYVQWFREVNAFLVFDFKIHQPSGWLSFCETENTGLNGIRLFLDSNLAIVDTMFGPVGNNIDYHECIQLANGNFLRVNFLDSIMDLSDSTFFGAPGDSATRVIGWELEELNGVGARVWHWRSYDHVSLSEWNEDFGYNPSGWRYCQGNSTFELPNGDFLVSFRAFNSVMRIEKATGQIAWRLGGNQSDFSFVNDSGFSGQHTALLTAAGTISLFDNHNSSTSPQVTRMVEYALDTQLMTATNVWEYVYPSPFHSPAMGSYEELSNGFKLINWGNVVAPSPTISLLDASDQIRSELFFENGIVNYRAYHLELPFLLPQPLITCSDGPNVTLSAPAGYASYLWSTGETTQTITVSSGGPWQFYVPYGDGFVASKPYFINDWINPCVGNSVGEPLPGDAPTLVGIYDLLGRRVEAPASGQVYIYRYSDGSFVKRVRF